MNLQMNMNNDNQNKPSVKQVLIMTLVIVAFFVILGFVGTKLQ